MNRREQAWCFPLGPAGTWLPILAGIGVLFLSDFLSDLPNSANPVLFGQLQFTSGVLAITFAGAALVRFRGTRERLPLILTGGFVIVGVTLASSSLGLATLSPSEEATSLRDPMTWVIGRTLLAILLVSAPEVEKRHAWSRNPSRDMATALILVLVISISISFAHQFLPLNLVVQAGRFLPRPGNLVPAAFFLVAALSYHRRLKNTSSPFDLSLYWGSAINFWCSLAAAQSDRRLDTAFGLASVLQFSGYAVFLIGALLDNVHLFRDIQRVAVTDPVTGLANYRRLIDSIEMEIQRTGRTGRPFALLLFDLDGLKKINDEFGHQIGTRALCRAADVLRFHSRAIDTGARQGGDEFALVLPETTDEAAQEVLARICDRAANDGQLPTISLSAGFAIYPRDGKTVETLMAAADRSLYRMKVQHKNNPRISRQVAV